MTAFTFICAIAWGFVVLTVSTGHLITRTDLNWRVAWEIFKCVLIMALFPAMLLPVLFAVRKNRPYELQHTFYPGWARLLTGYGKGGGKVYFFVEDVEGARLQRSIFDGKPVFLATIQFRQGLLGSRRPETVAISAENEKELRPLEDWLRANQIMVTWDLPLECQRPS